ncbi:MAG: hypothetical protein E4H26_06420 [Flavobacteriales bacterium]|nr:MAG: hypothetical protein E4H26_06420 [Flavobacteriales bacterium]
MATIFKNIFWSTFTSILQLYTGSVVFIVLAKLMTVNDFGILSFGFSLNALALIVADFGFSLMVVKDYPKYQQGQGSYFVNSLLAKMIISLVGCAFFFIYLLIFYKGEWLLVGFIYILFALVASYIIYLQAILRVSNEFGQYTATNLIYAIIITLVVILYWQLKFSLFHLVALLLMAKTVQLCYTFFLCRHAFIPYAINTKQIAMLLKSSWSFGVFSILGIFYFMVDTQIISLYLGAKEVALYQSVFRIILILMLFSDILTNVLLPYLSFKFYQQQDLTMLVSKFFIFLLVVGCTFFLVFTSFKSEILTILYTSAYQEAAILVLPFSMVLVLRTVSSLLGNILTISNKQVYRVFTVSVSLVISLGLNLFLIPKYGILAAAWTSVLVHIILLAMYVVFSKKEIPSLKLFTAPVIWLLTTMAFLYWIINERYSGNYLILMIGILIWSVVVYGIMKRDNNFGFLQKLLHEKGVG